MTTKARYPIVPPGVGDFRGEAGGEPAAHWKATVAGERLVPTHCSFCGVQCGMYLRVAKGRVVGVEPRNHDINKLRLCPKGVVAYQQVHHPDRLLTPLARDRRDAPLRPVSWDAALDRVVGEIQRVQAAYGRDAFGVLGGASMTTEKTYLAGKFARVALRTRHIDYNGRLCMVSAAAANKKAFGIDRAGNPWADLLETEVIIVAGTNIAECFPVAMQYFWGARDRGAKLVVVDPRETPMARTADEHVALRPGTDAAFYNGLLHVLVRDGLTDERFIAEHTVGWEAVRDTVAAYTPERVGEICGLDPRQVERVAHLWGRARRAWAAHGRGLEQHLQGVDNVLACINVSLATGQIGRLGAGYGTLTGQGNGQGGREHGQKSDMLPGMRDIENPEHRAYIAKVWGIDEADLPAKGTSMQEMVWQMARGEIRGLLGICNNPLVSLPNQAVVRAGYDALEFHAQSDFFLSETAARADVVLPTTVWAEDEGLVTNGEGRVIKYNKAVEPPGEARTDWEILCELARRLGVGDKFSFTRPAEILDELRVASRGGVADYYGITYEKVEATGGVFWPCPTLDHPGTPRPFEGGRFYHPDGKARFHAVEWRPPAEPPDAEYPLRLTTGRTVAHFLSGNQTRRLPGLVEQTPRPWVEVHPSLGFADGDPVRVVSRRGQATYPALVTEAIRPDTVFVPYHWAGRVAANLLTIDALDPISKMPEFKVCACRVERGQAVDAVPEPPMPPGRAPYAAETAPLAERRSPTMPQGRGTAEG
ncbi:MAG TPA: molybdopterin oxidoreductase family protein [Actinomycetes bacterium]|nr:molybdopterin oxidoreductase family protein [Actinomycetes bacterium]